MVQMKKPNCFECKYKEDIPGDCHIKCTHPSIKKLMSGKNESLIELLAIFGSVGRTPPMQLYPPDMNIKANERGVKRGWFNFPYNFDPVWLENCDGFEKK